jgi:hypothetical protein
MIKTSDILIAINKLLVKAYPARAVYINLCPEKFKRPSFYIEYVKNNKQDINCKTIQVTGYYSVTCFIETDGYSNSDAEALMAVQDDVISLFNPGYITVGDRNIKCKSSAGGMEAGASYVDVQFEYNDDRTDAEDATPLMASVTINLQEG